MQNIQLTVPATYQPLTIATGIRCSARRTPDKTMFIEGEKRRTFAEFCQRIDRLQAHALGELDRVETMTQRGASDANFREANDDFQELDAIGANDSCVLSKLQTEFTERMGL